MKSTLFVLVATTMLAAGCSEPVQCIEHENASYNRALAKAMVARGIPTTVKAEGGICFPASNAPKARQAEEELSGYFYAVAELMRDKCEEDAYVEWAKREGLAYELHDTNSYGGKKGRMINIHSFSAAEAAANAKKLSAGAPRGRTCP